MGRLSTLGQRAISIRMEQLDSLVDNQFDIDESSTNVNE